MIAEWHNEFTLKQSRSNETVKQVNIMNTNLPIASESLLSNAKFSQLAPIYNEYAKELGLKEIKKFRDMSTGIKRILEISEKYQEALSSVLEEAVAEMVEPTENKEVKAEVAEEIQVYKCGEAPKSETSAMRILYNIVSITGQADLETICYHFLKEYSLNYKGGKELNTGFAKGYVAGAVRRGHLIKL